MHQLHANPSGGSVFADCLLLNFVKVDSSIFHHVRIELVTSLAYITLGSTEDTYDI